ncbi:hypothetical protein BY458DRAFT_521795 [Sporodiniella umbellata]|nr:hypothetical protein BY458DRAFT_521795 [Sporodiniella umbellata]
MGKKPLTTKSKVMSLAAASNDDGCDDELDETIFEELCAAAKEGDIEKVESLVNNFNAPINIVDDWQCSPLYWACLCGHYVVVKFLLENGAQCDRNTFQGERCLYGALNSNVRNLLLSYKLTKAVDENQPYLLFFHHLFELYDHADLTFEIPLVGQSHEFFVHKFVLATRSDYLAKNLLGRWWDQDRVRFQKSLIYPASWRTVLRYLYTGYVDHDVEEDILENTVFAAKHLGLDHLHANLLEGARGAQKSSKQETTRLRNDFENLFDRLILLAIEAVYDGSTWIQTGEWKTETGENPEMFFVDTVLRLDGDVLFPCHRAFLCRSEYFRTLLNGSFSECDKAKIQVRYTAGTKIQVSMMELSDVDPDIFYYILQFIYTDKCAIQAEDAYDVLLVADMLLIDRLKALAAIAITNHEEPVINVYELIDTAIELEVDRVEQYCIKYFADHLDSHIKQPEFRQLIQKSAQTIKKREKTDTIPFIDDLRYFLGKKYFIADEDLNELGKVDDEYQETWTELESLYNEKLELLDGLLEELGLEA